MAHHVTLLTTYELRASQPYQPGSRNIQLPRDLNAKIEAGYQEALDLIKRYADEGNRILDFLPSPSNRASV